MQDVWQFDMTSFKQHLKTVDDCLKLAERNEPDRGQNWLIYCLTSQVVKAGIQAGKFIGGIAKICGGGGGGRPNMAQAGGKDTSKLDEALERAREQLQQALEEGKF